MGTSLVAALATVGALPMITPCIELADHKLSMNMIQTLARGIGGGALICMAVFMAKVRESIAFYPHHYKYTLTYLYVHIYHYRRVGL